MIIYNILDLIRTIKEQLTIMIPKEKDEDWDDDEEEWDDDNDEDWDEDEDEDWDDDDEDWDNDGYFEEEN